MSSPSRRMASRVDTSVSKALSYGDDEKTIPFLRRLRDMLQENEDVVSFHAGSRKNGQTVLGRIVVHDRARVQAEVLPRYFNHASFASLRRQLNYFAFTRVGKGRQKGATYCNEGVVELDDILTLKRRPAAATGDAPMNHAADAVHPERPSASNDRDTEGLDQEFAQDRARAAASSKSMFANSVVPFVHLPPSKTHKREGESMSPTGLRRSAKKRRASPTLVSPLSSSPCSEDETGNTAATYQQIVLDLTVPPTLLNRDDHSMAGWKLSRGVPISRGSSTQSMENVKSIRAPAEDEEVLSVCKTLLSLSHSSLHRGLV